MHSLTVYSAILHQTPYITTDGVRSHKIYVAVR